MKRYRTFFHLLITLASLGGFLVGWVTLAHSRKPLPPGQSGAPDSTSLSALPPIPSFNSPGRLQSFAPFTGRSRRASGLVTGGS